MKRIQIAVVFLLLVSSQVAISQATENTFRITQPMGGGSTSTPNPKEALDLLGRYKIEYHNNGGLEGRKILENVQALGLEETADNVKFVRSLYSSTSNHDEKVALTRLLGSLYTHDNKTGMNHEITQDLKEAIYSYQKDVARAGVMAYSRLGYFQDTMDVLQHAKNSGLIDSDEYYGEIAHLASYAPVNDQITLITKIRNGKNRYAMEILAFTTQDAEVMKKFDMRSKNTILSSLEENEPGFSQGLEQFSLIDAVRYSTWLNAVANLSSAAGKTKYEDVVLVHLTNRKVDPRKIMAFLISDEGKTLFRRIGRDGSFDEALERIESFYEQVPPNATMSEVVKDIANTVNSVENKK